MSQKLAQKFDDAFRDISHKINRAVLQAIIGVTLGGQPTPADLRRVEQWLHDESAAALGGIRRTVETKRTTAGKKQPVEGKSESTPTEAIDNFGAGQSGKSGSSDANARYDDNEEQPEMVDDDETDAEDTPESSDTEVPAQTKNQNTKPGTNEDGNAHEHEDKQTPEGEGRPLVPTDEAGRPTQAGKPNSEHGEPVAPNPAQEEATKIQKMRKFMFRNDRKFNRPLIKQITQLENEKSKDTREKYKIAAILIAKLFWHAVATVLYLIELLLGIITIVLGIGMFLCTNAVEGLAFRLPKIALAINKARYDIAQIDKNAADRDTKIKKLKQKILNRQRLSRFQLANGREE